jgi:hypothetical protein
MIYIYIYHAFKCQELEFHMTLWFRPELLRGTRFSDLLSYWYHGLPSFFKDVLLVVTFLHLFLKPFSIASSIAPESYSLLLRVSFSQRPTEHLS